MFTSQSMGSLDSAVSRWSLVLASFKSEAQVQLSFENQGNLDYWITRQRSLQVAAGAGKLLDGLPGSPYARCCEGGQLRPCRYRSRVQGRGLKGSGSKP